VPDDLARIACRPAAELVRRFATEVATLVDLTALYVGGSLASGDYHPGVSDLDLVALLGTPLADVRPVEALHRRIIAAEPLGAKLHCAYVPVAAIDDVAAEHPTFTTGRFWPMHLSGVARAEVLRNGLTAVGPPPAELIPPVSDAALRAAVRGELTGYWSGAVRKPHIWLQDTYVDLGLVTLARAEITLQENRLPSKAEAIPRLAHFGVDPRLIAELQRRRAGEPTPLGPLARLRRARHARAAVHRGIATLLR
jgi:hypothetical protein